ncbi:MAG: hypothetical protein ACKO4K_07610, partial [Flavobacteriales bacterium]
MKAYIAYRDSLDHWMRLLNQTLEKNGVNPDLGQLEFQALDFKNLSDLANLAYNCLNFLLFQLYSSHLSVASGNDNSHLTLSL